MLLRKKYCKVQLGPNTINKDVIETINGHFTGTKNLARNNKLNIGLNDLVVAMLCGKESQDSSH